MYFVLHLKFEPHLAVPNDNVGDIDEGSSVISGASNNASIAGSDGSDDDDDNDCAAVISFLEDRNA